MHHLKKDRPHPVSGTGSSPSGFERRLPPATPLALSLRDSAQFRWPPDPVACGVEQTAGRPAIRCVYIPVAAKCGWAGTYREKLMLKRILGPLLVATLIATSAAMAQA